MSLFFLMIPLMLMLLLVLWSPFFLEETEKRKK